MVQSLAIVCWQCKLLKPQGIYVLEGTLTNTPQSKFSQDVCAASLPFDKLKLLILLEISSPEGQAWTIRVLCVSCLEGTREMVNMQKSRFHCEMEVQLPAAPSLQLFFYVCLCVVKT